MNKEQIFNLFYDYAKEIMFIYEGKEYTMKVIDEIFFKEIIDKIVKK